MKNLNLINQTLIQEEISSVANLEYNDVMIYNEMADQPAVRMNLVEQIHSQLSQLDEMISRKQFVLKEVLNEVIK